MPAHNLLQAAGAAASASNWAHVARLLGPGMGLEGVKWVRRNLDPDTAPSLTCPAPGQGGRAVGTRSEVAPLFAAIAGEGEVHPTGRAAAGSTAPARVRRRTMAERWAEFLEGLGRMGVSFDSVRDRGPQGLLRSVFPSDGVARSQVRAAWAREAAAAAAVAPVAYVAAAAADAAVP
eukprot:gene40171-37969_t